MKNVRKEHVPVFAVDNALLTVDHEESRAKRYGSDPAIGGTSVTLLPAK